MNKIIIGVLGIVVLIVIFLYSSNNNPKENSKLKSVNLEDKTLETSKNNNSDFSTISADELAKMLKNKDFILIDVHIPEQRHIPQTDYMIPYNEISKIESVVPNKDSKIVLYCRSGSMSKMAAKNLVKRGYTNVIDLNDGLNGWVFENRPTIPEDSVEKI